MLRDIFTKAYLLQLAALVAFCGSMILLATGVIPKFW